MSHYFFHSAWTNETVTQNERNKPKKKKERKKKKKRHCEVLKKYYCLCLQNWEEQIKKIYENHKKSKHELLWKALKQKKAIKR